MRKMKIFSYAIFVLFLGIAMSTCKGDDGADGTDGIDGVTGADGLDGQDGNANVQTYLFESPAWLTSGSGMFIDMSDVLTNDIIMNDVILTYVKNTNLSYVYPVPGGVWTGLVHRNYAVFINDSPSTYSDVPEFNVLIISLEMDGSYTPNADLREMEWVKVLIIDSSNTTTTKGNGKFMENSKQAIYTELKNAGIDINDYYDVCDYYGINPK